MAGRSWHSRHKPARVTHIAGTPIRGNLYQPACGRCDVAPWEVCACSALLPERFPDASPELPMIADRINAEADARLVVALEIE